MLFYMFASLQSPKGGRKLAWLDRTREQENLILHDRDTGEPVIVEDYASITLAYSTREIKAGDRVIMKYSEAYELWKKLEREFKQYKPDKIGIFGRLLRAGT